MSTEKILTIKTMSCGHCEKAVEDAVKEVPGIEHYRADNVRGTLEVKFNEDLCSLDDIVKAVNDTEIYTAST